MILQCRECGKLQEHFVFKENGTWYARCEDCGMRMMLYDITKYLIPIGTEFMLYDGTIGVIKGYSTMRAKKFDDIYYIAYPIEPEEERRLECRQMSINVREMPECVRRYELWVQERREPVEEVETTMPNMYKEQLQNRDQRVMQFLFFNIIKNATIECLSELEDLLDKSEPFTLQIAEDNDYSRYTISVSFELDDTVNHDYGSITIYDHEEGNVYEFTCLNGDMDLYDMISEVIIYNEKKNYVKLRYSDELQNTLYKMSVMNADIVFLMKLRDFKNGEIKTVWINPTKVLTYSEDETQIIIRNTVPISDSNTYNVDCSTTLTRQELFNPWFDILFDQAMR